MTGGKHLFGSAETERKLDCLRQYLQAYSTALYAQDFSRIYIDAFAGTGDRTEEHEVLPIFADAEIFHGEVTTPGSAKIALEITPPFHSVVLIEKDPLKVQALKKVVAEYPNNRSLIIEGDANEKVQRICKRFNWKKERRRGVVFLDPYGMEVTWETVQAIAETEALDCWYFFPLSGLYRNAPKDSLKLDQSKTDALNRLFGTDQWRQDWYHDREIQGDLLSSLTVDRRTADVNAIEQWVHDRLATVFGGTVLKPLRLYHKNGAPMASLFFAVANPSPKAVSVAKKIADHILKAGISSHKRPR